MKKILISMLVLSLVVVVFSSVSFASNMPEKMMGFKKLVIHKANIFNSIDLDNNQKAEVMEFFKENNEKIKEVQKELKSAISELKSLKDEEDNPTEYKMFSNNDKITNLETIISNCRDQLSFLKTEQTEELKNILSAEQLTKLESIIENKQKFVGEIGKKIFRRGLALQKIFTENMENGLFKGKEIN